MLLHARHIHEVTRDLTAAEFRRSGDLLYAIDRRFELMGEAAKRISVAYKVEHGEIPWVSIVGLRNVLAHQYDNIDYDRVWLVIQSDIPALIALLEKLLPPPPRDPEPDR